MKRLLILIFGIMFFSFAIFTSFLLTKGILIKEKQNEENLSSTSKKNYQVSNISLPEVNILAGGDLMLGRGVGYTMIKRSNFNWPFEEVVDTVKDVDFSFFNLESPFYGNCKPTQTGMIFCADFKSVAGLVFAGIDAVNLSNNHIRDYGNEGLKDTKNLLKENGIGFFGEGENPLIVEIKGIKFAFLGYNEVGLGDKAYLSLKSKVHEEILKTRPKVDVLFVSFHWGNEYTTKISSRQKELAYLAIDSGADVVVGHHPHWIQEKEVYQEKPIYYSLGNFVFDQMWSEETREGILVNFIFQGKNLVKEEILPFKIFDFGQPRFRE